MVISFSVYEETTELIKIGSKTSIILLQLIFRAWLRALICSSEATMEVGNEGVPWHLLVHQPNPTAR